MRASMWSSYLARWQPAEMVREFARHGWQFLELSDEHGHDLLQAGDPLKVGREFRALAEGEGLSFPQGHLCLCVQSWRLPGEPVLFDIAPPDAASFETAMEAMRRWIDLFNALGIRAGVLHAGGQALQAAGWAPPRIFERRVEAVRRIAEYARGGPTAICLENLYSGVGVSEAGELLRIADAAGGESVGLCVDTGHAHLAGLDPAAMIRQAGPRLRALHIADNLGQADDHLLPYGRGTVRWAPVLEALRDVGYAGLFNFEVPGETRCPPDVFLMKLDYALRLGRWMAAGGGARARSAEGQA